MPHVASARSVLAVMLGLTMGGACQAQAAPPEPIRFAQETPRSTAAGTAFIVPAGWSLRSEGGASVLESPEGGSRVVLIDIKANDAEDAVGKAWSAYQPSAKRTARSVTPGQDRDGWTAQRTWIYATAPAEKRSVTASAMQHAGTWTVRIVDVADEVAGKREADLALLTEEVLPKGYVRESFAGRSPHKLDASRLEVLRDFIRRAQKTLGVPGISVGIVQDGKVVMAEGFGVRAIGEPAKVDADSLYLIASNTKSLTTLMLGKLVDEGKLRWDQPVTAVLPDFRLGDAQTSGKVQVQHLLCACTGLPRHDLEWLLSPPDASITLTLSILSRMQPTSRFGETYQYSNPIAAAAGLVGGHAAYPSWELGKAYDEAMQTRVFKPLGMARTTFSFAQATQGNYAHPYAYGAKPALMPVQMAQNAPIHAIRPAGGAWSNVNDLLKYVQMELARGLLPNGERYLSQAVVEAREAPQVKTHRHAWYGMGLETDASTGTRMVFHGGRMRGYRSNVIWLPDTGVGAVILTNADTGDVLMDAFPRKLMEVLFDGRPEADGAVAFAATAQRERVAAARKAMTLPAEASVLATLAPRYHNDLLGDIRLVGGAEEPAFDFGAWRAPIASRRYPDGASSLVLVSPGWWPEFATGTQDGKRTLILRDAQHEYLFTESG